MHVFLRTALLGAFAFAGGLGGIRATTAASPPPRIVGYLSHWNPADPLPVAKLDTLILAFAGLHDGRVTLDPATRQRLAWLLAFKRRQPALKVVVSVGGWGVGGFSEAAATPAGRARFADSAAQLLVDTGAGGLDVDWEYPGHHESGIASSPDDRADYTALLAAVRAALDRAGAAHGGRHYTLSVAVADGPFVDHIDIAAVNRQVDWFNLMTYDFVNAMTPTTGHHTGLYASALTPPDGRTGDRAVRQFLAAGVPARKLLLGAAFYGREFADVAPAHDGLYQPYGHFQGMLDWPELKRDDIDRHGYVRHWDAQAQAPWLWNAQTRHFITYEDPASLAAKAAYVRAHHLGGVMYWEQGEDPQGELLDDLWRDLHPSQAKTP